MKTRLELFRAFMKGATVEIVITKRHWPFKPMTSFKINHQNDIKQLVPGPPFDEIGYKCPRCDKPTIVRGICDDCLSKAETYP